MALLKRKNVAATAEVRTPADERRVALDTFRAAQERIEQEIGILQRDLEATAKITAAAEQRVADARQREATLREGIRELQYDLDRARTRHQCTLRTCEDPRVTTFLEWLKAEHRRVADAFQQRVEMDRNLSTGKLVPRVVADNHESVTRTLEALRVCRSTAEQELPLTPAHDLDAAIDRLRRSIPPVEAV